jgi:lon-related putative ATP-dependent protease
VFNQFTSQAQEQGFQVSSTNSGIYFSPIVDGKPLSDDEYEKLDEDKKEEINKALTEVQLQGVEVMRQIKDLERETKVKLKDLDNRIGLFAVGMHFHEMKDKYRDIPKVVQYLDDYQEDILQNINDFRETDSDSGANLLTQLLQKNKIEKLNKYKVNLLVDNSEVDGAPVLVEYSPTYNGLFGSLEYENKLGTLVTDFTMIKAGLVHRANGGYLILQAKDILATSFMWEGLKRVLRTKAISMENVRDQLGLLTASSLKPEPIPVEMKVVLVGSEYIYQILCQLDEEFGKLFKIKVDFDEEMEANRSNLMALACFIHDYCSKHDFRHLSKAAVIKVAEYSSRLVENQNKFTTRFNEIIEVIAEANTWAAIEGEDIITADLIEKTIEEKELRANKYDQKIQEMLKEGTIMVDTEGEIVGQINGLSILRTGNYIFGKPARITATTFMGRSGIVNIEREVDMSGTVHSKGVLILSGYIGEQYAQEIPLALTAHICFEQLYSGIDGDSASSAELFAILSSLSGVPIKQGIAVTGSVNQKGEIQAVGGVTKKIEGFFALCKSRGLSGQQGVIIPQQNISNLVLSSEVIDAVRKGKFHIYPIQHIDEGIEILMGMPAGKKLESGGYEKETVHGLVYEKVREYALSMVKFGKTNEKIS